MNRRALLIAIPAVALAGCTASQLAQWQTDAKLLDAGLQGVVPILQKGGIVIPAAVPGYLGMLDGAVQSILGAASASAAQAPVVQAAKAVNALVGVLSAIPVLPPVVTAALLAAQVLLPIIEQAVGINVVGAAPSDVSPDMARAMLMAVAGAK